MSSTLARQTTQEDQKGSMKVDPHLLCKKLLHVPYTSAVLHDVTKAHGAAIIHLKAEWVRPSARDKGLTCFVLRKMGVVVKARALTGEDRELSRGVLRMLVKQDISGVILIPHGHRFTDIQIRRGLRDGGALEKIDAERPSQAPDSRDAGREARSGYNKNLMLGSKVAFGKFKPAKLGREVTWGWVIDNHPGYIKWAFEGISHAFLHVVALRKYVEQGGEMPRKMQRILDTEGWEGMQRYLNSI